MERAPFTSIHSFPNLRFSKPGLSEQNISLSHITLFLVSSSSSLGLLNAEYLQYAVFRHHTKE